MKDIISKRKSIRSFEASPVGMEKIDQLFEAARWAPSARNAQPWLYVYAEAGEPLYADILETMAASNRVWAGKAPLLIVSLVKKNYEDGAMNITAQHDTGMANYAIALQATALGLQAHMIGGFDHAALEHLLGLPAGIVPIVIMAVGYPGAPEELPEPLRLREVAPRTRKPREEFVYNQLTK
ncbi:MAG: nitroreductase family protein [Chitinophagaceae bacterium]|nr:nitroreductase family protein [Chitinophagaceae bacterium]MCW5926696.1 nitroreductase family protein [Chitinophagaceae bacterium]